MAACDPLKLYRGISLKGDPRDNVTISPEHKHFAVKKRTFPVAQNLSLT